MIRNFLFSLLFFIGIIFISIIFLPTFFLPKKAEIHLMHGQSFAQDLPNLEEGDSEATDLEERRAYNAEGIFLAMVRFDKPTHTWHPVKVFQPSTPSPSAPVSI